KKNKDRLDVMLACDLQESVDSACKSLRVLLPHEVMEKNSHRVQPDRFGPAQFQIDALGIECVLLPHFQFVRSSSGKVVAPHQPAMLCVPGIGLRFSPATRLVRA